MLKTKKLKIIAVIASVIIIFSLGYITSIVINNYLDEKNSLIIEYDESLPQEINDARTQNPVFINDVEMYKLLCEDIFSHFDYYEGKIINITGYCKSKIEDDNKEHFYIGKLISKDNIEYSWDGVTPSDDWYGFEVISDHTLPISTNEYITIEGVFGEYENNGEYYMALLDCEVVQ